MLTPPQRSELLTVATSLLAADPAVFQKNSSIDDLDREIIGCVEVARRLIARVDEVSNAELPK